MLIHPRAIARWLTTQARGLVLDALGIREEVSFMRHNRREIEEYCAMRDDEARGETIDTLFPRISNAEFASAETERVVVPDGRTERAWPPVNEPAQETTPHRAVVREDVATRRFVHIDADAVYQKGVEIPPASLFLPAAKHPPIRARCGCLTRLPLPSGWCGFCNWTREEREHA